MVFKIIKSTLNSTFLNVIINLGDNMNQYENAFFHGLAGNIIVMNADELVINTSIEQLEKIIQTGGIYSRNKLKEHNIEYSHKPVENGNDFVSICVKNPADEEFTGYNEGFESAYVPYVERDRISLIINPNILETHTFRDKTGTYMLPGERQVKDGISLQEIIGITIMFENEDSMHEAISKVGELLQKYNLTLPLLNRNLEEIETQSIKL